jgi:hypothetical protein
MSFEDDILATVRDLIAKSKETVAYAGTVGGIDTTNKIVNVTVDGASAPTPCLPLAHIDFVSGQRVAILKAAGTFYVVGSMAFKRVVSLPRYTGAHPTGTSPGDMWYRDDLNLGYINRNGTPTSLT